MKKTITWILVADGTRACIVRHDGPGFGLKAVFEGPFIGANLANREIDSDRPGRTFDSVGQGRHAKEPPTDPRRHLKQNFARDMAALLAKASGQGAFDRLVVVAPPQALGDLRAALPAAVCAKVTGEVNKDLTHLPVDKLAAHLETVLDL
jgi:protein required for attachment to host cells